MPLNEAEFELEDLFVEPDVWKAGIGRALVDHCAAVARDAGAQTLKVIGNPHAEGFYRACGFEQIGRIVLRFGHGLILSKPLGSARPET